MTDELTLLNGDSPIGAWQAHPIGAQIIAGIAAQGGMNEQAIRLMRNIPLERLINANGTAPEGLLDSLVAKVNSGQTPDPDAVPTSWAEKITPGRFAGETVIVTGAASGIGRAVASRVAREGGRVIAVDVSEARLDSFVASLPDASITGVAADITSAEGIDRILAATGGRADGLANVAGLLDDFSPIHEVPDAVLERVFNVNVFGLIRLTRAVVPLMMERRSGSIVNIASEAALRGSSAGLAYTASKNAVVGITKNTAFMYEQYGIRSNAVAPGGTLTGMRPGNVSEFGQERLNTHVADAPLALPEALAASITFLLSSDGVNVNGAVLPSDGGESIF
ncbi:SDR family NAD(P)-dependent oxidoreductase [Microbacterium rhizomatis]|uniref:SDR family oxidoreductase n=1 Tax=Microbacterium rhizomatis TaxID=1631477 RepID=A0A5J5IYL0_9MICO|nr:SDR family oxidoreductase [Microbacterium rhizomatis]KAA9106546.1 SDR family oxidoreductase [Microbacterium rhizomatis]